MVYVIPVFQLAGWLEGQSCFEQPQYGQFLDYEAALGLLLFYNPQVQIHFLQQIQ